MLPGRRFTFSLASFGRLLALNRNLYGLEKPKRSPHSKKAMPFRASFRHHYWSVDVRYIEKHHIPDHEGPVYLISILKNYSRAVLASKVSPTQNQMDYLEVLFAAFSTARVPKAIVSDAGAIFYCHQAASWEEMQQIHRKWVRTTIASDTGPMNSATMAAIAPRRSWAGTKGLRGAHPRKSRRGRNSVSILSPRGCA